MKFIYGIGLLIIGVLFLIYNNNSQYILGLLSCIIGLYFLSKEGIEVNFKNKKYRHTKSLFNLSYGKWIDFPEIEYISVFKTTQTTRVWVSSASTNVTEKTIKVNLFYNTNQKIEAYETKNIDDAFKKAKDIAAILNIDILDATERESKWL